MLTQITAPMGCKDGIRWTAHLSLLHRLLYGLCVVADMGATVGALIIFILVPLEKETLHRHHVFLRQRILERLHRDMICGLCPSAMHIP